MIRLIDKTDTLNLNGLRQNKPQYVILHSTRSYSKFQDILNYHKNKRGWAGLGYHLFIDNLSNITQGRPYDKEGAHALGFNTSSIGICFYSPKGKISRYKVMKGKDLIRELEESFGSLDLLSHTQAQVKYTNKLLEEYGLDERFLDSIDVVNEKCFIELKNQMDRLVGKLDTDKYSLLKNALKSFKNCPGELFYEFIK